MSDKPIILKPGTKVDLEPAKLAETMEGFVWRAQLGGQLYEVVFTGEVKPTNNIELLIKEHLGEA